MPRVQLIPRTGTAYYTTESFAQWLRNVGAAVAAQDNAGLLLTVDTPLSELRQRYQRTRRPLVKSSNSVPGNPGKRYLACSGLSCSGGLVSGVGRERNKAHGA